MKRTKNSGPALLVCSVVFAFFFDIVMPADVHVPVARADGPVPFTTLAIDNAAPQGRQFYGTHTKAVGDINGDGYPDPVVAGATAGQSLVWYASPAFTKNIVSDLGGWSTDAKVGDVDNDGDQDIVISCWYRTDAGIEWFENLGNGTSWAHHPLGMPQAHNIQLVDMDLDGDLDIVTRLQDEAGKSFEIWRQDNPQTWQHVTIDGTVPTGEGLAIGDMNRDAYPDVIVNGSWYANPHDIAGGTWAAHPFTSAWTEPNTIIGVGDINRDGRLDIALTPSESAGNQYHVSWFEAPADPTTPEWTEHVIDPSVETVLHSLQLVDIDNDGDLDLVTAKMQQGTAPNDVSVYINVGIGGKGTQWSRQVIATTGSHSMKAADFDRDGDIDLLGANWSDDANVYIFRNDLNQRLPLDNWTRYVIDDSRPWNAVFITAGDIDRDGLPDVIAGGWWYRNPGTPGGAWPRNAIGSPLNNMAAVYDYDQDGSLDILGTPWAGTGAEPGFVWAHNNGQGKFAILNNTAAGVGDFLQGVAVARFTVRNPLETALSWHNGTGQGVQMLTTQPNPLAQPWTWRRVSTTDEQEQLSAGDIDRDGDLDVLLGTQWLRNNGNGTYDLHVVFDTPDQPDRNRLGDINKDGRLDAIVGYAGISVPTKLAWYEQGTDPLAPWTEHVVATVIGAQSLDVADLDLDGDLDIVVGEHNLAQPETARAIVFENADGLGGSWVSHVVYTGDEHHDGTQLVDIDKDGDLDIISVGWGHPRTLLYQNNAMESGLRIAGPPPTAAPTPTTPASTPPNGTQSPPNGTTGGGDQVAGTTPASPTCGACGTGATSATVLSMLLIALLRYHKPRRYRL